MIFHAHGHPNIRGTHKNTMEFTKDEHLSVDGDCIIGVRADFDTKKLANFAKQHKTVKFTLSADNVIETFTATMNPDFTDKKEAVIRIGEFVDGRTLAFRAEKSAKYLSCELITRMKNGAKMEVSLEEIS
ncbi:MAG TPA: DUF371 domain-containing protein [Candidatus Nanoarchaeia archaeon]|nr:DUF371 domain-containing protein [Candidatus Nanoarchaeia archaeon]